MAKPLVISTNGLKTDFKECLSPRLLDILKKYYQGKVFINDKVSGALDLQIIEHVCCLDTKSQIKYNPSLPLVVHHTEGDPKYFQNIEEVEKHGVFLHSSYGLEKGKFFSYWQYDYLRALENLNIKVNRQNNLVPRFLCLNGRPDTHRYFVLQYLNDIGYIDNGLISFLNRYNQIENLIPYNNFKNLYEGSTDFIDELVKNKKVLELDITNNQLHKNDRSHNPAIYENTSISLITETYADERPGCFITEKSWKPIANMHFPIWIAQKGIVSAFRHMGYDVFDDLINHEYDTISNCKERWKTAVNSMCAFLGEVEHMNFQTRQKLNNRLLNNQNRFFTKRITQQEVETWL